MRDDPEKLQRVRHAFLSLDRLYLARAATLKRQLAKADPEAKLPNVDKVIENFRRVFEQEMKSRGFTPAVWVGPFMVEENARLFAEHPDYFPLVDGKRYLDAERANQSAQSQLCLTSPGLRKLWVEKLRGYIRAERKAAKEKGLTPPINYMIDQNDCADGFCRCPACAAIIEREGGEKRVPQIQQAIDQLLN